MSEELIKQQEARIEELQNEITAMKAATESEKLANAVKEAATTAQNRPAAAPSAALQDLHRAKVIKEIGQSHYSSLPMEARLRANGQGPASAEEIELSKRLFGRNSSSLEANREFRNNRTRYQRLRTIFHEL
jgi:cell wall-associated NlpC family hydrolase